MPVPKFRNDLTAEQVRQHLDYDPLTGIFTRCGTGVLAGCDSEGYVSISLYNRKYCAHRLAWLYVYGEWPTKQLDHINMDRSDNRIGNLREATTAQNSQNARCRIDNVSGVKGVAWDRSKGKWQVNIASQGIRHFIGRFDNLDDAAAAYENAARALHGEFANPARLGEGPPVDLGELGLLQPGAPTRNAQGPKRRGNRAQVDLVELGLL